MQWSDRQIRFMLYVAIDLLILKPRGLLQQSNESCSCIPQLMELKQYASETVELFWMKLNIPLSTCMHIKRKINSPVVYLQFYLGVFCCVSQPLQKAFMGKKNELFETPEREICYIQGKENGETETSGLLTEAQESRGCKMCSGSIMNSSITNYCHREMLLYMNFDIENWMDFLFVCMLHLLKMKKSSVTAVYKCVQICCLRSPFFLSSISILSSFPQLDSQGFCLLA